MKIEKNKNKEKRIGYDYLEAKSTNFWFILYVYLETGIVSVVFGIINKKNGQRGIFKPTLKRLYFQMHN